MSENRERRTERRQRFLRHRRLAEWRRGVSPVVATLILVLIAVAAAAALYIWLIGWQGGVTSTIGKPTVNQGTFTIGGSTSVYPFDELAVTQFEQNNSGVSISNNQGGTGAGMLSVCSGAVDVGAASTPQTISGLIANSGCPTSDAATITITTIAYDAVDVIVPSANAHGLLSLNYDTLDVIYSQGSTSAPNLPAASFTIDGAAIVPALLAQGTEIAWDQIPAAVQGAVFTGIGVAADSPEALDAGIGAGAACTGAGFTNDVCSATGVGGTTPCGWTVCAGTFASEGAGPTFANAGIVPVERSDASGTTQTFEAKLLGYTAAKTISTTFAGLGYSGCGSNNLLSDCGILLTTAESGNPGVISEVASNPNAIGYASDGLVRATGSGVAFVAFDAVGQAGALPVTTGTTVAYGAVLPTTGATGTIAAGITGSSTVNQYSGWRPFELVTLAPPVGLVQQFITFVLDPANNQNLATATGEVSVYSV